MIKNLKQYFAGYKVKLVVGPAFKLLEAILELFIPIFMAKIIDIGIKNADGGYVLKMGLLMLLFGAIGLCSGIVCQYFAAVVAYGFGRQMRKGVFAHILKLSAQQVNAMGTSTLITRMTNDVSQVQNGVNIFIRLAVRAPFLTIGCVIMAFIINAKIAFIFVVAVVLISLVLYIIMGKSIPQYKGVQQGQDIISRKTGENLSGARVIRAFSRQDEQIDEFVQEGDILSKKIVKVGMLAGAINPLTFAIANLAIVFIVWVGAKYANLGFLASGDIIALVSYMTQTMLALVVLVNMIITFNKAIASGVRVSALLDIVPDMQNGANNAEHTNSDGIRFDNVTYSYTKNGEGALENITFNIPKGKSLGIIGGTGSGKSTLVQLVARNLDADSGKVLVDGINVKDYGFSALKAKIGMVFQTSVLIKGTIRENMLFANPNATDEDILKAFDTAQATEVLQKIKDGLDYEISEGGKNLSGGQKQRFAIARALVKKPEILILDDSASALDYATDAALRKAIKHDCVGMTVVMVSQRAATIKGCDLILVLDDGKIVAQGTHSELLQSSEVYHEICLSQNLVEAAI